MRELCGPPARLALPWQPAVWAAGFCKRPGCGAPFLVRREVHARVEWPTACSRTCSRAMQKAGRKTRRTVVVVVVAPRSGRVCRRCGAPVEGMCPPCAAAACCRNKRRYPDERRAGLAAAWRESIGGVGGLVVYECPVCSWWHMGHWVHPATRVRVRAAAAAYVASLDPAVVVELVLEWTPGRTIRR